MDRRSKIVLGVLGGILAVALLLIGWQYLAQYLERSRAAGVFTPHLDEYLALQGGEGGGTEPKPHPGKVVIVEVNQRAVDWDLFFGLPESRRAKSPDEVGVVVLVNRQADTVSLYTSGAEAIQHRAAVSLYDRESRQLILRQTVKGGPPPATVNGGSAGHGAKPDPLILQLILSYCYE